MIVLCTAKFTIGKAQIDGITKTPVSGIGDDAYYVTASGLGTTLNVKKGSTSFSISDQEGYFRIIEPSHRSKFFADLWSSYLARLDFLSMVLDRYPFKSGYRLQEIDRVIRFPRTRGLALAVASVPVCWVSRRGRVLNRPGPRGGRLHFNFIFNF